MCIPCKVSALIFAGLFLISGCKPNKNLKTSTTDSLKNTQSSSSGSDKKSVSTNEAGPAKTKQNIAKNESNTTQGKGIVGRWIIDGSEGDVVLEFTTGGDYIWFKDGNIISRGTYTFDEAQNSMEMTGRGRREVKVNGNKMTEKVDEDITLTYKRL